MNDNNDNQKNKIISCKWGSIISFISIIIIQLIFTPFENRLNEKGYDIVSFELAWNKTKMDAILNAWGPAIKDAIILTYIDFLFLIAYPAFLACFFIFVFYKIKLETQTLHKFQLTVLIMAGITSFSDFVENLFSLYVLYNTSNYSSIAVTLMSSFSVVKWALAFILVLLNIGILIVYLWKIISKK